MCVVPVSALFLSRFSLPSRWSRGRPPFAGRLPACGVTAMPEPEHHAMPDSPWRAGPAHQDRFLRAAGGVLGRRVPRQRPQCARCCWYCQHAHFPNTCPFIITFHWIYNPVQLNVGHSGLELTTQQICSFCTLPKELINHVRGIIRLLVIRTTS